MKKAAIIMGSVIIVMVLAISGLVVYTILNQPKLGIIDRTSQINVMLIRPDNWKKIAKNPVISEEDMAIIEAILMRGLY